MLLLSVLSYLSEVKDRLNLSLSSQLHRSLHYDLVLISRYSSISLLPSSTPMSTSILMTRVVRFSFTFFYQKITRLLSSSPGARLWESSVIRRKSPSFIVFFSFFLLLFLLCGRHSGVNIIDATATRRYCEHVNECSQQVL